MLSVHMLTYMLKHGQVQWHLLSFSCAMCMPGLVHNMYASYDADENREKVILASFLYSQKLSQQLRLEDFCTLGMHSVSWRFPARACLQKDESIHLVPRFGMSGRLLLFDVF